MLLYLDTSCMAKLFLMEADTLQVRQIVQSADSLASSLISFVEMRSVFSRRLREKLLTIQEFRRALDVFETDWPWYAKVHVDLDLIRAAGELAHKHQLKALDAIHLASAIAVQNEWEEPVVFLSADKRLQSAAHREKLKIVE
jgi:predicted nucleic acid-binding protein